MASFVIFVSNVISDTPTCFFLTPSFQSALTGRFALIAFFSPFLPNNFYTCSMSWPVHGHSFYLMLPWPCWCAMCEKQEKKRKEIELGFSLTKKTRCCRTKMKSFCTLSSFVWPSLSNKRHYNWSECERVPPLPWLGFLVFALSFS